MIMPKRSSTDGCGNTMRTVEQATSQSGRVFVNNEIQATSQSGRVFVNNEIQTATDGSLDYSAGQPLYQGNSRCDPAREGTDDPKCCGD